MSQLLGGHEHDGCLRLVAEIGFLLAGQAGHSPLSSVDTQGPSLSTVARGTGGGRYSRSPEAG